MSRPSKEWVPKEGDVVRWKGYKDIYILTRGVSETRFSVISMKYNWVLVRNGSYTEEHIKECAEFVCKMPNIEEILDNEKS